MAGLVFCGEALIDFLPATDGDRGTAGGGGRTFRPAVGGSPFNAARAAARLGGDAAFLGALSTEFFGDMLAAALAESAVDLSRTLRTDAITTLAFVDTSGTSPRYAFHDEGTASRTFDPAAAPPLGADTAVLHIGSVSLIGNPGADAIARYALAEAGRRVLSVDPNVRPGLIRDWAPYIARMETLFDAAGIIRLSDEDLAFLHPGADPEAFARARVAAGTPLVVVTFGAKGARAFTAAGEGRAAAPPVTIADTVGAGDTLVGALLVHLAEAGALTRDALAALDGPALDAALGFAVKAAAVTCSRVGADPPRRGEV